MKHTKFAGLWVSLAIFTLSSVAQARDVRLPKFDKKTALLMVDAQYCFMPGGSLPVTNGQDVVPVLKSYAKRVTKAGGWIVASRDWHPANHSSFAANGGPWPAHCVQGTAEAQFHRGLSGILKQSNVSIVSKGTDPGKEAYSAFEGTGLSDQLRAKGVTTVLIGGLATDYCVKATAMDALKYGFKVFVLADASQGVEVKAGDIERAVKEMQSTGATIYGLK